MKQNNRGFTLIELLISTAFFSFILLFVTFGFVQVNSAFNKGITVKKVHETARFIVEDVSRSLTNISSSSSDPSALINIGYNTVSVSNVPYNLIPPTTLITGGSLSIGNATCFRWTAGYGVSQRLLKKTSNLTTNCSTIFDGVELIDDRIALQELTIRRINPTAKAYSICVILSTDSNDLSTYTLGSTNSFCRGEAKCSVAKGDQYCDTVTLSTVITLRK